MANSERQVKLYRTLIGVGIAVAIVSLFVALLVGTPIPMALWVPVSYAFLAWVVYRIVLEVWERAERGSER